MNAENFENFQGPVIALQDPRFTTAYSDNYRGPLFFRQNNFYLPVAVSEEWCEPGYQPVRKDKGYSLTVNDYPFHSIQYGGPMWSQYVHTPLKTYNEKIIND